MTIRNGTLRVALALEETPLHQPIFVDRLLSGIKDSVVCAALIFWAPPKSDAHIYLARNLRRLRANELIKLAAHRVRTLAESALRRPVPGGKPHSVRSVLERHGVPYFEVRNDINRPEHLAKFRESDPDVIISSQVQVFKPELLAIPKLCCINRHSSPLPAYAGLWPVFHAIRNGEKDVGVTVHTMERRIDAGDPLVQRRIPRENSESMSDLYAKCFEVGADACLDALDRIRAGEISACATTDPPSYYSFPTPDEWRAFRARGGRII